MIQNQTSNLRDESHHYIRNVFNSKSFVNDKFLAELNYQFFGIKPLGGDHGAQRSTQIESYCCYSLGDFLFK